MPELSAIIFIPDDTAKTGYARPMMLQNIMGTPLLTWLSSELVSGGVGRFFLVCHERFKREARECFPKDIDFRCPSADNVSDELHVFLSTADETEQDIIVVTGPAVILPYAEESGFEGAPLESNVSSVSRQTLMDALDDKFIFTEFLKEHGTPYTDRDGVYSVSSLQEFADWQPILNTANLRRLSRQGVEIWDYGNTYVDPSVRIGSGTAILPGTILRGNCSIGRGCTIGPNSFLQDTRVDDGTTVNASQVKNATIGYDAQVGPFACIRPGTHIGNGVKVGNYVEVKNATVGDGTQIPHLAYVGESEVGAKVQIGFGAVTADYDRVQKNRTVIEDEAFVGCNTSLVAPVRIGHGSYIAAGSTVCEDVPAQALAIDRSRQTNKKEWSSRHKLPPE